MAAVSTDDVATLLVYYLTDRGTSSGDAAAKAAAERANASRRPSASPGAGSAASDGGSSPAAAPAATGANGELGAAPSPPTYEPRPQTAPGGTGTPAPSVDVLDVLDWQDGGTETEEVAELVATQLSWIERAEVDDDAPARAPPRRPSSAAPRGATADGAGASPPGGGGGGGGTRGPALPLSPMPTPLSRQGPAEDAAGGQRAGRVTAQATPSASSGGGGGDAPLTASEAALRAYWTSRCAELFRRDGEIIEVPLDGLCDSYPPTLLVPSPYEAGGTTTAAAAAHRASGRASAGIGTNGSSSPTTDGDDGGGGVGRAAVRSQSSDVLGARTDGGDGGGGGGGGGGAAALRWQDDSHLHRRLPEVPRPPLSAQAAELRRYFQAAHLARVRSRFVAPVLRCRYKYVCRSGTLSHEVEVRRWGLRRLAGGEED